MPNSYVDFMPYDQQMAELQRRQRMAELMAQQANAPLETPQGGRMVAKVSPLAGLAKLLQGYNAGSEQRSIEKQRGEVEQQARTGAMDWLDKFSQGKAAPMSPDQALQASMSATPTEAQRVPFTPNERNTELMRGAMGANPYTSKLASALMAQKPEEAYDVKYEVDENGKTHAVQYRKNGDRVDLGLTNPYSKSEKPAAKSADIQAYELAQSQGYKGTFEQWHNKTNVAPLSKAPSGFRYTASGDLEPIPGGPNDPNAPKAMPPSMLTANITDAGDIKRMESNKQLLQGFINDIGGDKPKLPLSVLNNAKYQAQQTASGLSFVGQASDEAVRFFDMKRAVEEQVNAILNQAKGPQTDQDALRAKRQILENLNDPKIVTSGLKRLQDIYDRESGIRRDSIEERNQMYGRATPATIPSVPAPPPGFQRQQGGK